MPTIIPVSTYLPHHGGLSVCTGSGEPVKVLVWQPVGDIQLNTDRGPCIEDELFLTKARTFVKKARIDHVDLLLTPEYSFPISVLSELVTSTEMWPEPGALWAFGIQGINKDEIPKLCDEWKSKGNIMVIDTALESLKNGSFVSSLVYVFRADNTTLCVLPQFKTHPMADSWNEYEASYLSTGEVVFEFDLSGETRSSNSLLSIICSDVHNISSSKIIEKTVGRNLIVCHPQLNPKPRHRVFRLFREGLFEIEHSKQVRLLTLNWAAGTMADSHNFDIPWSSLYQKSDNTVNRTLVNVNHARGTYFARNNTTNIWFGHREEHCRLLEIRKGDAGGVTGVGAHRQELIVKDYFKFDENIVDWTPVTLNQYHDLVEMIGQHGPKYDFPLNATVDNCDLFFGTCFGHMPQGEINTDELEVSSRLLVGSDRESDQQRRQKARLYRDLIQRFKQNHFPQEFSFLNDNHVLKTDDYFYDHGYTCNLYEEGETNPFQGYTAVITSKSDYGDVEQLASQIMHKLHAMCRERLIVYYRPLDEDDYTCLGGRAIAERRISRGDRTRNLSSIRG